jgi:thiol-disulfide isomerase/thioredoxin
MQIVHNNISSFYLRTKLFVFGFLFFSVSLYSQKRVADFSIQDSDGNSHVLYEDYLNKDKIVILDLFFTDCPPCNTMAPYIKASYEKWDSGNDQVQFFSLSPVDLDQKINSFREIHQLIHPSSGIEGGGDLVLEQFINDFFGPFFGYPTLILVKPSGEVIFDIHSSRGDKETIELLNFYIENELKGEENAFDILIFPNPSIEPGILNIKVPDEADFDLNIYDTTGRLIVSEHISISDNGIYNYEHLISDFDAGLYFITINVNSELVISRKFIIL